MIYLDTLLCEATNDKVNLFFLQPDKRQKLKDSDIVSIMFACRAINNIASLEEIFFWAGMNRPKLINDISKSIIHAGSDLDGSGLSLEFKLHGLNDIERAFTLISALEVMNLNMFDAILNHTTQKIQIQIFDFLIRFLHFRLSSFNLLKINGTATQDFIRQLNALEAKMLERRLSSSLLQKTKSMALANQHDFQGARNALDGVIDHEASYARLQIAFREACAAGNFPAAQSLGISMIKAARENPSFFRKSQELSNFNAQTCHEALRRTYGLLDSQNLDPFLISGTLLGMVRDGKIFDHDKDFDIAVIGWRKQFDVFEILYKCGEYDLDVRKLTGDTCYLLPARHKPTGIECDIFFMQPNGDYFQHGVNFELGFTTSFLFTKFNLFEREFSEDTFRIPEQWERNLQENYGPGWSRPDPGYDVLLEAPAIHDKMSGAYKVIALDRILGSIAKNDDVGLARKIEFLKALPVGQKDEFATFLHEFSL